MNAATTLNLHRPVPAPAATRRAAPASLAPTTAAGLRERVLARLAAEASWDAATSNVYVEGDTVVLQGLVRSTGARSAARRIVAALPGVRQVQDARVLPREG